MIRKIQTAVLHLFAAALLMLPLVRGAQAAEHLKPFILASTGPGDMQAKVDSVKSALTNAGFDLVGDYVPYKDAHIIIFTSDHLKKVAAMTKMGGFGAVQRASVTKVGNDLQVAYTNPVYVANAYRLKDNLSGVADKLAQALGRIKDFGSEDGMTPDDLRDYHYTFGMEYFDDPYELATYKSYDAALKAVEQHLKTNKAGVRPLYHLNIPGKQETVFGVSMKAPPGGDQDMDDTWQMHIIDFKDLKQTAYLPYQVMVLGNKVIALHMRFRAAVFFPDLSMMGSHSFMKLMSSPAAIRKALTIAVGGQP
ncbi:MAG TPA: hypothetical protein VKA14_09630 [Gammaproteobacteria bacterium]|nr:hypothetical protein [Gammaproteobacteria bacterium]